MTVGDWLPIISVVVVFYGILRRDISALQKSVSETMAGVAKIEGMIQMALVLKGRSETEVEDIKKWRESQ